MIACLTVGIAGAWAEEEPAFDPGDVQVYLPRQKTLEAADVRLDDIAILTGQDRELLEKASAVRLGRAPLPGETLTLTDQQILARLAGEGVPKQKVNLLGADSIDLNRNAKQIASDDLVAAADAYLEENPPENGVSWKLVREPQGFSIPGGGEFSLSCAPADNAPEGYAWVVVSMIRDNEVLHQETIKYRLTYRAQRAVATEDIAVGQAITPQNTRVEIVFAERRPTGDWEAPFGATATKAIQEGAVVSEHLIQRPQPKLVVERNETIQIKLVGEGWVISTLGTALQDGRVGETIKVRNIDSRQVIVARVAAGGHVEPIINQP
jgi:flagella basal body P-ring formation protein FlgA